MFTVDRLHNECETIQAFLEIELSENPIEAVERGKTLMVYVARTSQMVSDAKYLYAQKINSDLVKSIKNELSDGKVLTSKAVNLIVDSCGAEEKHLVNWCDKLVTACKFQLDFCRTIISLYKTEYQEIHKKL